MLVNNLLMMHNKGPFWFHCNITYALTPTRFIISIIRDVEVGGPLMVTWRAFQDTHKGVGNGHILNERQEVYIWMKIPWFYVPFPCNIDTKWLEFILTISWFISSNYCFYFLKIPLLHLPSPSTSEFFFCTISACGFTKALTFLDP